MKPYLRSSGITLILVLAVALPRLLNLGGFMTADEKQWISNTRGFTRNLALLRWDKLLQQAHPGITTQWLGAPAIQASSLAVQKFPLVLSQCLLIGVIGYLSWRLWGKHAALFIMLLLALNPFLIAHTRVYAMDSLLAAFSLIALLSLLLWDKIGANRYVIAAGAAAALAILSKLPALILIPFTLIFFLWSALKSPTRLRLQSLLIWAAALIVTAILIFPSLALNFPEVFHASKEFLLEGDAQETHYASTNPWYYLQTLFFFSTPFQLLALLGLPWLWSTAYFRPYRRPVAALLIFSVLFILQMSIGAKKGDRYILPVFAILDVVAALTVIAAAQFFIARKILSLRSVYVIAAVIVTFQAVTLVRLHPHTLAYVNPLTKPWYGQRRLGWGEGFEVAADYLNQKPGAAHLKVASYYPKEFAYVFAGEVIPVNHYAGSSADYIVLYRAMYERGESAWETDILRTFASQTPEKVIRLNGLEYVWIYPYNR